MEFKEKITKILDKIGVGEDALYYWALYQNIDPKRFAIMKISGQCIEDSLDTLTEDISYIYLLGLVPIIIHGWGNSLTKRLSSNGIESKFIDGDRFTDRAVMGYVEEIARETQERLSNALEKKGVRTKIMEPQRKIIIAKEKKDERFGEHNGDIVSIDPQPVFKEIEEKRVPIISSLGISSNLKLYNINAALAGAELVKVIDPEKYIMVTASGGVLSDGRIVNEIVLRKDYERLTKTGVINGGMKKNVDEAKQSLEERENGEDRSVQIVGPGNLLKELFSFKGAGTFIREGYSIANAQISSLNQETLKCLIENEFKEELKDDFFAEKGKIVYFENNFKGLATVLKNPRESGDYLDVLVVNSNYARNGLGSDIVSAILSKEEKPKLFWRSKPNRTANNWYFRIADGHQIINSIEGERYNAFWMGLSYEDLKTALEFMKQRSSNFKNA